MYTRRPFLAGLAVLVVLAWVTVTGRPSNPFFAGQQGAPASSPGTEAVHNLDTADIDKTCKPCQDFYKYADGGWLARNPIPPAYPSWGRFNELQERNREMLHQILERAAKAPNAPGSNEQKIGDFYASCMDESKVEADGIKPLEPELARIEGLQGVPDLEQEVAHLQSLGVSALFRFSSTQDEKNSTQVIGGAEQGGLGMPDRDYYTKTDEKSKQLRGQYVEHVTKMFELMGDDPARAAAEAKTVMSIETTLAEASMTRVERRDPEKTYHKMGLAELKALTPNLSWPAYFDDVGFPGVRDVDVAQPKFFTAANAILGSLPLAEWKTYLRWHLIDTTAPSLSSKFVEEDFNFNGRVLQGTQELLPRWKRCVRATDRELGFALGRSYVTEHFPPAAKARAKELVHNLIAALGADISTLAWMGPETRQAALSKLNAVVQKIGYPDKWRDYSAFQVDRGPYVMNVLRGDVFEFHRDLAKIGKPVDRTEWFMTPPTVNAYYDAEMNEIVFPAGILQPPFFDAQADDAVNYGAIGAVIGHEMTHGFDDQGRKFDAEGNLKNWWTRDDLKNYEARAACVEKQFDAYVVTGSTHENGKLVLGESIADLGGLTIAYKAYEKTLEGKPHPAPIDGFTAEQRFFLAYAQVWAANDRPQFELLIVNTDPHPLDRFRAIAAPSNLPEFAQAFGCHAGDPMVRSELCQDLVGSRMIHEIIPVGMLQCNCSILGDEATGNAIVIDPGDDVERVKEILARHNLTARYIVATHAHIDHVGGVEKLQQATGARVLMHQDNLPLYQNLATQAAWLGVRPPGVVEVDQFLKEGDVLRSGALALEVLHTPGHSPGSLSLHLPGEHRRIFSGDTLFRGSIGRTDLWGGDYEQILRSIQNTLLQFPDETPVFPGHSEPTTIGKERESNPFLQGL